MGIEQIVNDLYKFLKTDVTDKSLFEATDRAYADVKEGKLPTDPSEIADPTGDIQKLAEEKKEKGVTGDVKPAEMTDEVAKTKVEKVADKETPKLDKKTEATKEGKLPADLSQVKNPTEEIYMLAENEVESPLTEVPDEETAKNIVNKVGPGKARSEKNSKGAWVVYSKESKEVKVTGVKVEGAKNAKDVLKDQQKSKLKEEKTTEMPKVTAAAVPEVSTDGDKTVEVTPVVNANPDNKDGAGIAGEANDDSNINKVANANPDNKDGTVVKEEKTTEPTTGEVKAVEVPEVDADKATDVPMTPVVNANPDNKDKEAVAGEVKVDANVDAITNANPDNKDGAGIVKEEVEVDVKAADQIVTVTADDQGGTTVTTTTAPVADVVTTDVVPTDVPVEDAMVPTEEEMPAEELEVAEKLFVVDYLSSKKSLSEKEQKFVKAAKSITLSNEAWHRVNKKLSEMKAGK